MSEDARTLAFYLLTSPHTTLIGAFRLPDGYACEDLQWLPERVAQGFAELLEKGFANRCETTKWAWILKFLEWNAPENPNQWKAARRLAAQVPQQCRWNANFQRVFARVAGDPEPSDGNPSETVAKPFRNQEQEQEQEHEQDSSVPQEARATVKDFHQKVLAAYHELLPELPAVRDWSERRRKKLDARVSERLKAGKPADQETYWRALFGQVQASDFLCGRKNDWRCPGLEWLLEPKNFTKVIEGSYNNVSGANGAGHAR